MSKLFPYLKRVKWSDNLCTVGWSCIWAWGWDRCSIDAALRFCPRGYFTTTTYVDGDERRGWSETVREEKDRYGMPVYVIHKGSYFSFPLDRGALQLMQALGLVDECMVMAAGGGRHKFPDDGWKTGGVPLCQSD